MPVVGARSTGLGDAAVVAVTWLSDTGLHVEEATRAISIVDPPGGRGAHTRGSTATHPAYTGLVTVHSAFVCSWL